MRLLFLAPNVPFPPSNGGHQRTFGLIRGLAHFASLHVLAIGEPEGERTLQAREAFSAFDATLEVHRPTGPRAGGADEQDVQRLPDAVAHFCSPSLAEAIPQLLAAERFDAAHVEEVVMAQYLDHLPCPRVLDRQKIDWAYHEAMAGLAPRQALPHLREAARFRNWERRLVGRLDRMLVPGVGDRDLLVPLHGTQVVDLVPIAIADDLGARQEPPGRIEYLLLYGALDYPPNVEAQAWFFQEVWPTLRARAPQLKVLVVGSGRPPVWAASPPLDPSVELRGFVADVAPLLSGPGALVVPVHVGGGARTKVIEALACGMPIVSTSLGVENLDLEAGRHFLLADSAEAMIAAIDRLLADSTLCVSLAREAARAAEPHRWRRVEALLQPIYRDVAATTAPAHRSAAAPPATASGWGSEADARHLEIERAALRAGVLSRFSHASSARLRRLWLAFLTTRCGVRVRIGLDWVLTPSDRSGPAARLRRLLAWLATRLVRPGLH